MNASTRFDPTSITAAVLAGGEGRRVDGRDKGLLPLFGRPLVTRAVHALQGQAGRIVICANRHRDDYATYGDVLPDTTPGFHGPLAGIASALAACRTPWLLTIPVDCPDPPLRLAQRLFDAVANAGCEGAAAFDGTRRQPLFALYNQTLAASAQRALDANLPVWRWQDDCGLVEADFSDRPSAFDNLNTEADFRAWEREHDE